jgi:predicted ArsR family transcriptional regulator
VSLDRILRLRATYTQRAILMVLAIDGGELPVSEIAHRLGARRKQSGLHKQMPFLVERGFVRVRMTKPKGQFNTPIYSLGVIP